MMTEQPSGATRFILTLLGSFQATLEGEPIRGFESNRVRALLAYLAIEFDRPHLREKLMGMFWPDWPEASARNNLRGALSNLRKAIGDQDAAHPFLCISRQTIQLNRHPDVWVDAITLAQLLNDSASDIASLKDAVELYRGEFLEGFSLSDSPAFEEWLLLKREQFRRQVSSALQNLATIYANQGEYVHSLPYAWRQVALDPWHEDAHRHLMRLLALGGQRGAALAQYETCRRILAQELGVAPAVETTQLYERIRDETFTPTTQVAPPALRLADSLPAADISEAPGPGQEIEPANLWARLFTRGKIWLLVAVLLLALSGMVLAFMSWKTGREAAAPGQPEFRGENIKVALLCGDDNGQQICVEDFRTRQVVPLVSKDSFAWIDSHVSWSPDGKQLVFSAEAPGHPMEIYIVEAEGEKVGKMTLLGKGVYPSWSPDGRRIAYQRDGELWVMRPDGAEAQQLSLQVCAEGIAWSPDSQWIAFLDGTCSTLGALRGTIQMMRPDGSNSQIVYAFDEPLVGELAWDPAGKRIACSCFVGGEAWYWILTVDGNGAPLKFADIPPSWQANHWPQWAEGR
jgi:DNA-binding SARP family transcriptional activator